MVNPRYLDPHILPIEVRTQAISNSLITESFRDFEKRTYDTGYEKTTSLLCRDTIESNDRQKLLGQFKAYTNDLDRIRGTSLRHIVPELKPFL